MSHSLPASKLADVLEGLEERSSESQNLGTKGLGREESCRSSLPLQRFREELGVGNERRRVRSAREPSVRGESLDRGQRSVRDSIIAMSRRRELTSTTVITFCWKTAEQEAGRSARNRFVVECDGLTSSERTLKNGHCSDPIPMRPEFMSSWPGKEATISSASGSESPCSSSAEGDEIRRRTRSPARGLEVWMI